MSNKNEQIERNKPLINEPQRTVISPNKPNKPMIVNPNPKKEQLND